MTLITQQCVEWKVNSTVKSTQYGCLRISIFEHATPLFGQDAPPPRVNNGYSLSWGEQTRTAITSTASRSSLWGAHPQKGQVGLFRAEKLMLYLYELTKKMVSILYLFGPELGPFLYCPDQNRGQSQQFWQKLISKLKV